jgi:hypothetical protein
VTTLGCRPIEGKSSASVRDCLISDARCRLSHAFNHALRTASLLANFLELVGDRHADGQRWSRPTALQAAKTHGACRLLYFSLRILMS